MALSYAIIGPLTDNTETLIKNIELRGGTVIVYKLSDIHFDTKNLSDYSFFSHDIYIFRGYNRAIPFAQAIANSLLTHNKTVIDNIASRNTLIPTKINEALQLSLHKIKHPQTFCARNQAMWLSLSESMPEPLIVKPENAQKGQGIHKFEAKKEALKFLSENPRGYIAQEYIETHYDIRIIIVGSKVLGAIKRFAPPGDFRTNASLGGATEKHILTDKEKELALRAHSLFGYDVSGVDIITNNDMPHVLEVNITPQWGAFEKTTGINVAREIINHSMQKHEKNTRIS